MGGGEGGEAGWGGCFSDGKGFIFKWGSAPCGGIGFDGRVFEKNYNGGARSPMPPPPQTMGSPVNYL